MVCLGSVILSLKSRIKLPLIFTRKGKASCKTIVLSTALLHLLPGRCVVVWSVVTRSLIKLVGDVPIQDFSLANAASVSVAVGRRHSFSEVQARQREHGHNSQQDGHFTVTGASEEGT